MDAASADDAEPSTREDEVDWLSPHDLSNGRLDCSRFSATSATPYRGSLRASEAAFQALRALEAQRLRRLLRASLLK